MTKRTSYSRTETDEELRGRLLAANRIGYGAAPVGVALDAIAEICKMQRRIVWVDS